MLRHGSEPPIAAALGSALALAPADTAFYIIL